MSGITKDKLLYDCENPLDINYDDYVNETRWVMVVKIQHDMDYSTTLTSNDKFIIPEVLFDMPKYSHISNNCFLVDDDEFKIRKCKHKCVRIIIYVDDEIILDHKVE